MSMLEKLGSVPQNLTPRERISLEKYVTDKERPLSPTLSAQLFELYLHGSSCEDIQNLNKGLPLGAIVLARIDGKWDERLEQHRASLLEGAALRVKQTQLESIGFISDMLAATHKLQGQKLKKYLQTGDDKELGDIEIKSMGTYKTVVELLLKLTGQDKDKGTSVTVNSNAATGTTSTEIVLQATNKVPTPEEADGILKVLETKASKE